MHDQRAVGESWGVMATDAETGIEKVGGGLEALSGEIGAAGLLVADLLFGRSRGESRGHG